MDSKKQEVYNPEKKFAEQALGFFKHDRTANIFMKPIIGVKDWFETHVDGVYIIATKSDRVCNQGNNMVRLAEEMLKPVVKTLGLSEGKTGFLSCAAVDTSDEFEKEKFIRARTQKEQVDTKVVSVDPVPEKWPDSDNWKIGSFNFPNTFPRFDKRVDCPSPQKGLDAIISRVLGINE